MINRNARRAFEFHQFGQTACLDNFAVKIKPANTGIDRCAALNNTANKTTTKIGIAVEQSCQHRKRRLMVNLRRLNMIENNIQKRV